MNLKGTVKWIGLALIGLLIAGGVALAASTLTSEKIGISSEPVSAGDALAPRPHRHGGAGHSGSGRSEPAEPTPPSTEPTTTEPLPEPEPAPEPLPPVRPEGDDGGGGGGGGGGDD
ncbi:MAG: hypothetical protein ACM3NV_05735 [Syntrophothermus sp.]